MQDALYYLIEKDETGSIVARYNMDTDKSLTKQRLIQLLKLAHDNPERWAVVTDDTFIHPSEGYAPGEHMDASDLIVEMRDEIDKTGLKLNKSDIARISMMLSQLFKDTYGVGPRSISKPLKKNPQVWAARKQAYPPGPFLETARQAIVAYCVERMALIEMKKDRDDYLDDIKGK
jgi:hypothetical protein